MIKKQEDVTLAEGIINGEIHLGSINEFEYGDNQMLEEHRFHTYYDCDSHKTLFEKDNNLYSYSELKEIYSK